MKQQHPARFSKNGRLINETITSCKVSKTRQVYK
jgi:hypothetical protein